MTILHVIDQQTGRDAIRQLAQVIAAGDEVVAFGQAPLPQDVPVRVRRLHVPMGSSVLAGLANSKAAEGYDAVHACSPSAARAGELMARRQGLQLLVTLAHLPARQDVRHLRRLVGAGTTRIAAPTVSCRNRLLNEGLAAGALCVIPPAVGYAPPRGETRRRARSRLNIADDQRIIVVPGEITVRAGHKYACWAFAVLRQIRDDVRLLIPSDGPAEANARYFAAATGCGDGIFFTAGELSLEEALAAADLAIFTPTGEASVWPVAAAMAAALPIVAWRTEDVAEITAGGQAAELAPPGDVRAATAAAMSLLEDERAAHDLAAAAAELACERFAASAVRRQLEEAYSRPLPGRSP